MIDPKHLLVSQCYGYVKKNDHISHLQELVKLCTFFVFA